MVKKKQRPEESKKRAQILQMADKMFMSQGFSSVSMDALAEAVPVSKRTLYDHFKDKKSLFTAVMQGRCQFLSGRLEQTMNESRNIETTLTEVANQFLDVVLKPDSVNLYRTAITESQNFPELGKLFFEMGPKRIIAVMAGYLQKMHDEGKVRITKPELAAKIFIGMITNRIQMEYMLGLKKSVSAQEKSEIVKYAVDTFLYGHKIAK